MPFPHAILRDIAFEGQTVQAANMRARFAKAAVKKNIGDCVSVPLATKKGRSKFDGQNLIGVVVDINEHGSLRIVVKSGVLKRWYDQGKVHRLQGM